EIFQWGKSGYHSHAPRHWGYRQVSIPKTLSGLMWAVNNIRLTVNVRLHFLKSKDSAHDCKLMKMLGDEVFAIDTADDGGGVYSERNGRNEHDKGLNPDRVGVHTKELQNGVLGSERRHIGLTSHAR